MMGVVVKTVRQLEEANKSRAHPRIIVEGELASNILASGILKPFKDNGGTVWKVAPIQRNAGPSPINDVIRLLNDIAYTCTIDVVTEARTSRIAIYPKPVLRREGN